MKRVLPVAAILTFAWAWAAPAADSTTQPATRPGGRVLAFKNLRVDLESCCVILDAKVCLRAGPLEFVICRSGTKEYESLMSTPAEGSQVHAALLALGLTPGKPARYVEQPDSDTGRVLPPQGAQLKMTVRWKDAQGKLQQAEVGDWMTVAGGRKAPKPEAWVFVGSQILPDGRYWADVEGEVVSCSNFASAVIDVPFESSNKNALRDYLANTAAMPPEGTAVEVVISPLKGAQDAPHARALLEIDAFGRIRIDARPILPSALQDWGREFIAKHAKGMVQIRPDARALAYDIDQARDELRMGGVFDTEVLHSKDPDGMILPRTSDQSRRQLEWWTGQFADYKNLISDPAQDAQAVLEQIRHDIENLQATQEMWGEYAKQLQAALVRFKASTQPAGSPAPTSPGKE